MKKLKLYTNEAFSRLVAKDYVGFRKNEGRWDSLDLDDLTTDINVPTQGEIDSAIRELDLVDDAVINTGATPSVDNTGAIELDFDDKKPKKKPGRKSKKLKMQLDDDTIQAVGELDFDDKDADDKPSDAYDGVRELDLDNGKDTISKRDSKFGAIGKLDYDDDINADSIVATVEDVYIGLASSDGDVVQGLIKRYASELDDSEKLKEIMLTHAVQGNYDSLRAVCGDMRITLTPKEKELGYIDKAEVDKALKKLRKLARSLTGANNTYGLIPNAIANCKLNDQLNCINIVDFLYEILGIPLQPVFYRGAFLMHCYDLADYLLEELGDDALSTELMFGKNGLVKRASSFNDVPDRTLKVLSSTVLSSSNVKRLKSKDLSEFIVMYFNCGGSISELKKMIDFSSTKGELIIDYIEDNNLLSENVTQQLTD